MYHVCLLEDNNNVLVFVVLYWYSNTMYSYLLYHLQAYLVTKYWLIYTTGKQNLLRCVASNLLNDTIKSLAKPRVCSSQMNVKLHVLNFLRRHSYCMLRRFRDTVSFLFHWCTDTLAGICQILVESHKFSYLACTWHWEGDRVGFLQSVWCEQIRTSVWQMLNNSSAVCWDGRPFGHNRHGPKSGAAVPLSVEEMGLHLTHVSPGSRPTSVPSGTLIHPTVWQQHTIVTDRTNMTTVP